MQLKPVILIIAALSFVLTACSLPRGAGFQSEVLGSQDDPEEIRDFAVEIVTRDSLPQFANWPQIGPSRLSWIDRTPQAANRIIAAGDVVSITIWSNEENGLLTSPGQRFVTLEPMRVSSSGTVFLPYVGSQRISGMSPQHARETIENKYIEVTPSAQVQLEVQEGRQNTVSLVGGVSAPGTYPMPDRNYSILSLISDGGGAVTSFNNPQVRLQRGSNLYGISMARLLDNPGLDTTLVGGDKVYVEEDERFFLSLGAAGSEARHDFTKSDISALEALSVIGGVADTRANPQGILILRQYSTSHIRQDGSGPTHSRVVFTLDLTSADGLFSAGQFEIQSGDLVYATESPITATQTVFQLLGSALGLASRL
ncbi:polysaccharide biosynthesis/export family protein [Aestuariibius sp. HNIBRBA575]|uniref:polysaccharide biosynthesis/export family protein n=1 Tax=Aestuariibius sp. HNIBRBA575 TaxID=3233343 RepID=UPI0034A496FD